MKLGLTIGVTNILALPIALVYEDDEQVFVTETAQGGRAVCIVLLFLVLRVSWSRG